MKYALLLAVLGLGTYPVFATAPLNLGQTDTNWPGIVYQITFIKRIPPDRILVGIRIYATPDAPRIGTLIGIPTPIPANASPKEMMSGIYRPRPFDVSSSVMTEDSTQQQFPALPPVAPPGQSYRPGKIIAYLSPGQNVILTVQFAAPPPPPPPPLGQPPVKQTVSFLFTNAKSPIKKIVVPPPLPAAGAAAAPAPATSP